MRASRVLYVENDPALCGIMTTLLRQYDKIDIVLACSSPQEVLGSAQASQADVALLDLALGPGVMNGVDLGLALRQVNPNIGIVLHSQYPLDQVTARIPTDQLIGWSTMRKSADLDIDAVVRLLRETARGISVREQVSEPLMPSPLESLSSQQRAIIAMVAAGMSGPQIGEQLSLQQEAVRQELSRVYRILIPDSPSGSDRRTQAVLEYLRLSRDSEWDSP